MRYPSHDLTVEQWFHSLFSAKIVRDGGVVRRKLRDVERMVGRDRFVAEIERRGFTALVNGGQVMSFAMRSPCVGLRGRQTLIESLCQILDEDLGAVDLKFGDANSLREFDPNPR